jgi:hypothetical protein
MQIPMNSDGKRTGRLVATGSHEQGLDFADKRHKCNNFDTAVAVMAPVLKALCQQHQNSNFAACHAACSFLSMYYYCSGLCKCLKMLLLLAS